MKLVREVLKRLDNENLILKLAKCEFFQSEVNWLGHKLSPTGIVPKITKTEAILNLHPPKPLKQLRSFLGSINHLSIFILNAASLTNKLRPLLRDEHEKKKLKSIKMPVRKFDWEEKQSIIFDEIKQAVANNAKIIY